MIPFLHRLSPNTMEENPLWLVVLCDMMTNLMLFFLVMYVLTQQGPAAQREILRTFDVKELVEDPRSRKAGDVLKEFSEQDTAPALSAMLQRAGIGSDAEIEATEASIRVRLLNKVLFGSAEYKLAPGAQRTMALLARVLREIPNEVVVEGHTDDVPVVAGPYRSNWELSVARSYSVIERLVREGVPPRRLVAAGYGEYHPVAPNDAASRGRNRRVEIVILRDKAEP